MKKKRCITLFFCCFLVISTAQAKVIKKQEDRTKSFAWNVFKVGAGCYVGWQGINHMQDTLNTARSIRLNDLGRSLGMLVKKTGISASLLTAGYLTAKNGLNGLKKNWVGL